MDAEASPSHGTPVAEYEIECAFVAKVVADQHPDLVHLPLRPIDAGWDNAMFRLGDHLEEALAAYARLSEATIRRAKGWAVLFGIAFLDSGLVDNPRNAAITLAAVPRSRLGLPSPMYHRIAMIGAISP